MTSQPLRAGIIGLGVGRSHAKGYQSSPDATLAALCDTDTKRLQALAQEYNVPDNMLFTDYREMLAKAQLDMVSVCLPNSLHAESTISALEAGVHVLCEKPMAASVAQAQHMLDAAKRCNRHLMIAYNHRYRADMQWIRRMMEANQLGTVYHVHALWRRETGIPGSGWFGNRELAGGGSMIDLGVHVLDLTLWLTGYPAVKTVSGQTRSLFGKRGLKVWSRPGDSLKAFGESFSVEDGAVGFLRLANGVSVILEATWAEHRLPHDDLMRIEVQGTEGTGVVNVPNYTREDTARFYCEMAGEAVTITPKLRWQGEFGHEAIVMDCVKSLHEGLPLPTTGEQGMVGVKVLEALYESAQAGHEIVLG